MVGCATRAVRIKLTIELTIPVPSQVDSITKLISPGIMQARIDAKTGNNRLRTPIIYVDYHDHVKVFAIKLQ